MNDRERFDKHQSTLLKDDPSTTAFYNAQIRTQQRVSCHPIVGIIFIMCRSQGKEKKLCSCEVALLLKKTKK